MSYKMYAIAALGRDRTIGLEGKLPWNSKSDLERFKKLTTGFTLIMGRKTYESIGRPLPKRKNIILTRDKNYEAPGCIVINDLSDLDQHLSGEVFVIGGSEIYELFSDRISGFHMSLMTLPHPKGDVFMPESVIEKTHCMNLADHELCDDHIYYFFRK